MQRTFVEEQRRFKKYIAIEPPGFVHNMQPSSVKTLMEHIGLQNIANATVLEVGCGQGYLLSHFLNLNAQHVIGTDITPEIINSIPSKAFDIYRNQGKKIELKVEDFLDTPKNIEVNVITMFIGNLDLVYELLDMFLDNPNVQVIAFMKPTTNRIRVDKIVDIVCEMYNLSKSSFSITLSGSNEQRKTIILKKNATSDEADDEADDDDTDRRNRTASRKRTTMRVTRRRNP